MSEMIDKWQKVIIDEIRDDPLNFTGHSGERNIEMIKLSSKGVCYTCGNTPWYIVLKFNKS